MRSPEDFRYIENTVIILGYFLKVISLGELRFTFRKGHGISYKRKTFFFFYGLIKFTIICMKKL
jgi:hypothetical protein